MTTPASSRIVLLLLVIVSALVATGLLLLNRQQNAVLAGRTTPTHPVVADEVEPIVRASIAPAPPTQDQAAMTHAAFLTPLPATASVDVAPSAQQAIKRSRLARLDTAWFASATSPLRSAPLPRVELALFDDAQFVVKIERVEELGAERRVATGIVEGRADSEVILAYNDGALAGQVSVPGHGTYAIEAAGNGVERIVEIDLARAPLCGTPAAP
jgi:hypothetical protein